MPDPQIIPKRDGGTDAYGLYLDFIVYAGFIMSPKLIRQERYFLVRNMLCKYVRQAGNKRAAWRAFKLPNHDDARELLHRSIALYKKPENEYAIELVHKPMLVELANTDIDAIDKGDTPYARFAGTVATERAVGKIDDETWAPKVTL